MFSHEIRLSQVFELESNQILSILSYGQGLTVLPVFLSKEVKEVSIVHYYTIMEKKKIIGAFLFTVF